MEGAGALLCCAGIAVSYSHRLSIPFACSVLIHNHPALPTSTPPAHVCSLRHQGSTHRVDVAEGARCGKLACSRLPQTHAPTFNPLVQGATYRVDMAEPNAEPRLFRRIRLSASGFSPDDFVTKQASCRVWCLCVGVVWGLGGPCLPVRLRLLA